MTSLTKSSKYHRNIQGVMVDTYDICRAFGVTDPALAHAIKKILMPGTRGAKGLLQDLEEARWSLDNAIAALKNEAQPELGGTSCLHPYTYKASSGSETCIICGERSD